MVIGFSVVLVSPCSDDRLPQMSHITLTDRGRVALLRYTLSGEIDRCGGTSEAVTRTLEPEKGIEPLTCSIPATCPSESTSA